MFGKAVLISAAVGLVVTGCGSTPDITKITAATSSPPAAASSAKTTATMRTQTPKPDPHGTANDTLSPEDCLDVLDAFSSIILAATPGEAQPYADTLLSYAPPANVADAVNHFVETGGIQFDDEEAFANNTVLQNWVDQVCPS